MRIVQNPQPTFGQMTIKDIKINPKSRDDIDKLLKGLQALYCDDGSRNKLFAVLSKMVPEEVSTNTGRPGMELWRVFVLALLRLNLNWDYDRLTHMANNHSLIRKMLGHSDCFDDAKSYEVQTIKDNFALLTPEMMEEINLIIVNFGHSLVKKTD